MIRRARLVAVAAALAGSALFAPEASAQRPQRGNRPERMQGGDRMQDDSVRLNRQLSRLTEELTLTSAQQQKVRALLVEEQTQMRTLRGQDADREARFTQMKAIRELNQKKIEGVLTAEQKTKFQQLRAAEQKRFEEGRGRRGPGGPGGPPRFGGR
jgi:Spy/CpxP family protein refolding chaperone